MMDLRLILQAGLAQMNIVADERQQDALLVYVQLMHKWNKVYNLTAIRQPSEMLTLHIFDSLSVLSVLDRAASASASNEFRVLDVGSGGGLPGIVLAIMRPAWTIYLLDIVQKKTAFQRQAKAELGLKNVFPETARVEQCTPETFKGAFDVVISRAFADTVDFIQWSGHLCLPNGHLFAMKGPALEAELQRLPADWRVTGIETLHVAQLDAQRHVVLLSPQAT
jgi:16S rRNA (guanine527-N7)-methyltransferase